MVYKNFTKAAAILTAAFEALIDQTPEIFHSVEGYQIAVMGRICIFVAGTAENYQILSINIHACIMA